MQKPSDQAVPYSPFHDSEDPAFHSMYLKKKIKIYFIFQNTYEYLFFFFYFNQKGP